MKVLFVGNSYLSLGGSARSRDVSPYTEFQRIAEAAGHEVVYETSLVGGASLEALWNDSNGTTARGFLEAGDIDVMIIQGQINTEAQRDDPNRNNSGFEEYGERFVDLATANGTDTVFMGIWASDPFISIDNSSFNDVFDARYEAAAIANDAYYAPVGVAYRAAYEALTERYGNGDNGQTAETLLTVDNIHANDMGAYLAGLVMYLTTFGGDIPEGYVTPNIGPEDAQLLREIALDTVVSDGINLVEPTVPVTTTVSGRYFIDANGDGQEADSDGGVVGATVSLHSFRTGELIESTVTDVNGAYEFTRLDTGSYVLHFENQGEGYTFTVADTGPGATDSDVIELADNGDGVSLRFHLSDGEVLRDLDAGVIAPNEASFVPEELLINGALNGDLDGDWTANGNVAGWQNESGGIELWQDGFLGYQSEDGSTFVELDRDGGGALDNLVQSVQTDEGAVYSLSFTAQQRGAGDDQIEVYFAGALIATVQPEAGNGWTEFSFEVTGSGGLDRLELREVAGDNTGSGPLIDTISLTTTQPVEDTDIPDAENPDAETPETETPGTENPDDVIPTPEFDGTDGDDRFFGTSGDDVILGRDGADLLSGKDGNDYLDGGAGSDVLNGLNGDDTIVHDLEDESVNGGSGVDTFLFKEGSLDIRDQSIRSVEVFDLSADGSTALTLDHSEVFQARDADLRIIAGSEDTVQLESRFAVTQVDAVVIDDESYDVYQVGEGAWANYLQVDSDANFELI